MAIPLPVQPVGCEGRRRNGSLPVPARGAAPACSPAGLLPWLAPGARLPPGRVGLGRSRQAPKAVSNLLPEQPFPGHPPACPKSTVLCDLPAGRAVQGAREELDPRAEGGETLL